MISRKPTRIELNMENLEEYDNIKKEQTAALKKEQQDNIFKNTPSTPSSSHPLVNTSQPPKASTAKRIGLE
eukprot:gene5691-7081_t